MESQNNSVDDDDDNDNNVDNGNSETDNDADDHRRSEATALMIIFDRRQRIYNCIRNKLWWIVVLGLFSLYCIGRLIQNWLS